MHHAIFIISHFINYLKKTTIVKPYGFKGHKKMKRIIIYYHIISHMDSHFFFTENKKMPGYGSGSSAPQFSVLGQVTGLQIRFWWTMGRAAGQTRWRGDTPLGHEAEETVSGAWHACETRSVWNGTPEHQVARGGSFFIGSAWFLLHSTDRPLIFRFIVSIWWIGDRRW